MIDDMRKYTKLAEEIIQYIRKRLSGKMNYLTPVFYYLTLFPVEEQEPMATDGKYLFYNPIYVIEAYKNNPQKLQAEYMHIMAHCILGHIFKRKGTHEKIYDAAADYTVAAFISNLGVKGLKEKINLPEISDRRILDNIIKSGSLVRFYEYLCHHQLPCKELLNAQEKLHKDNHIYWNHLHPELKKKLEADGTLKSETCAAGQWFEQYRQEIMKAWENLIYIADKIGGKDKDNRIWGSQAGLTVREFAMTPENNISYKDFLRRFMVLQERQKIDPDSFDYTWYSMGMRLYQNIPLIEPLETCEENITDDLIIALDTSGSCMDAMGRFLRETYNILSDMNLDRNVNIRIIQCDTKVRDDRVIHNPEDLPDFSKGYNIKGLGGTNFIPVFNYIDNLLTTGRIKRVRGLLFFSDGYGDFPKYPPAYETVFIFPPNGYINTEIPKWITKVILTDEDIHYS